VGGQDFKRKLLIATTDLYTGQQFFFDETMPKKNRAKYVIATGNMPGIFKPKEIGKHMFIDGGMVSNTNVAASIVRCQDLGFDDSKIVVDVLTCPSAPTEVKLMTMLLLKIMKVFQLSDRKAEFDESYYLY
jgi:predicted acylesterase/phospholipase RssA